MTSLHGWTVDLVIADFAYSPRSTDVQQPRRHPAAFVSWTERGHVFFTWLMYDDWWKVPEIDNWALETPGCPISQRNVIDEWCRAHATALAVK